LNVNEFITMEDARQKLKAWQADYNDFRPHGSLWAVPGFKDTLFRCLMEPEVLDDAAQEVFQGVQA
jgi:hypothetical protein